MGKKEKKKEEKKVRDSFSSTCASIISGVVGIGIFVLVTLFPLVVHDSYFDILETKYICYYMTVLGTLALSLAFALVMMFIDCKEYQGEHTAALLGRLRPGRWRETFYFTDIAALVFWLVALISTIQSDYRYEAFWGNEGRFTGLFLLTLYVVFYFLVTRFWKPKGWYMELFLFTGVWICLFGFTDYFRMDIMGWRVNVRPDQLDMFTSTLGNVNSYTAYVGLMMGYASAMFCLEERKGWMCWYYICMVISFAGIITGTSDNAYLGAAALFGLTPFVLFRERKSTGRYLFMLATFFTVVWCIAAMNRVYADRVVGLQYSAFRLLAEFKGLGALVAALWALALAFVGLERKSQAQPAGSQVWCRPLLVFWGVFTAAVILFAAYLFFDANVAGHAERYGAVRGYLVFDDAWGTNRGYIWRKAIEMYREFPLLRKIVGYGPDTFGILAVNGFRMEMVERTRQIFDSAHNEYLQYLITIGAGGLLAYLCFLVSALAGMARSRRKGAFVVAAFCAVLCYVVQAVVNLNLPVITPIMWLILSIGVAGSRKED